MKTVSPTMSASGVSGNVDFASAALTIAVSGQRSALSGSNQLISFAVKLRPATRLTPSVSRA